MPDRARGAAGAAAAGGVCRALRRLSQRGRLQQRRQGRGLFRTAHACCCGRRGRARLHAEQSQGLLRVTNTRAAFCCSFFFSRARARAPREVFFARRVVSLSLSSFDYFLSRVFEYSYAASRAVCPSWKREDSNVGRVCSKRSPYFRRSAPDDPEFLPYYKMLKVGAPPPAVAQKMATVTVCVWLTFFEEEGNAFQKSSRFGERFFFSFWRKTFLRALGQRRQGRVADRGDGAVRV